MAAAHGLVGLASDAGALASAEPLLELSRVSKDYDAGGGVVHAMREVSLSVAHGEFVAIVGASGSGKSTMMNILGCLDRPSRGAYLLAGVDVGSRAGDSRAIVRNRVIGFIFQGFNLLPRTTALENVELPLQYRGVGARERRRRAKAALEAVGLGDRMDHKPSQLSGGQQQRVAIARALVTDPPLLLADEPTGNLDTHTSLEVLALLQRLNRDRGITIVLVTHERDIAACASRVITMRDGRIVSDVLQDARLDAAEELARLPLGGEATAAVPMSLEKSDRAADARARVGGPVPLGVYFVMLLGAVGGAAAGAAYVAAVLGATPTSRAMLWIPIACAIVAESWAGARWARRKLGRPATSDQRVRIALWYSIALAVVQTAVALVAKRPHGMVEMFDHVAARGPVLALLVVAGALAASTLLRYLLLTLFSPRR